MQKTKPFRYTAEQPQQSWQQPSAWQQLLQHAHASLQQSSAASAGAEAAVANIGSTIANTRIKRDSDDMGHL